MLFNMCVEAIKIFQINKTWALYLICDSSFDAENIRHFCKPGALNFIRILLGRCTQGEAQGSSPLRSDDSHGGQARGGSGRAVAQRRPKTPKGRDGKQLWAARRLYQTRAKGRPLEKYLTATKKESLTLSRGWCWGELLIADGEEWEPQWP
jgi:hypothetical protein